MFTKMFLPFFQTFYSNSAESNSLHPLSKRSASGTSGNASNGSEYILPPEIRAEIVAAAKRGKLQQYLQLRKHRFVTFDLEDFDFSAAKGSFYMKFIPT